MDNLANQICNKCGLLKPENEFYKKDKSCKDCRKPKRIKLPPKLVVKKRINFDVPASEYFGNKKEIVQGDFFIPNIMIVGIGRNQSFQNICLKCKKEYFCIKSERKLDDLFCLYCQPDKDFLKDENKSSINYVGNIKGWKVIYESETKKRLTRNYKNVFRRDNFSCQYCNYSPAICMEFRNLHIDHIKPVCAGGNNSMSNLCVSCDKCNLTASGKWFKDFHDKKTFILSELKKKNLTIFKKEKNDSIMGVTNQDDIGGQ